MDHPIRVAIVGAGPAGFFAAEALFKQGASVEVDLFNRYPPPFGLVRDGVAPDHEPIKSVTRVYQRLLDRPEVRYLGNVEVGKDVSIDELRAHYHQVVYAFGAQSDRRLGIPGEDLAGSAPATEFVGWYNGHPAYATSAFDLSVEHVVVIGNGNVAIDVARILVLPLEVLEKTDIADHALEALRESKVRRVTLFGRRGPAQAAFTNPELREFGKISGVSVDVLPNELDLDPESARAVEEDRTRSRNLSTLRSYAEADVDPGPKEVRFRFLCSPTEILGEDGRVTGVRVERNRLEASADGRLRAVGTGEVFDVPCGMVLRSVGYLGTPLTGVPHEPRSGTVPNQDGRVLGDDGATLPGEYVVGWAKRGPSGVIGTNKADAAATVQAMIEDAANGVFAGEGHGPDPRELLATRGVRWIDEEGWARLDAHEKGQGEPLGRPRVKVCSVDDMLGIAGR